MGGHDTEEGVEAMGKALRSTAMADASYYFIFILGCIFIDGLWINFAGQNRATYVPTITSNLFRSYKSFI